MYETKERRHVGCKYVRPTGNYLEVEEVVEVVEVEGKVLADCLDRQMSSDGNGYPVRRSFLVWISARSCHTSLGGHCISSMRPCIHVSMHAGLHAVDQFLNRLMLFGLLFALPLVPHQDHRSLALSFGRCKVPLYDHRIAVCRHIDPLDTTNRQHP